MLDDLVKKMQSDLPNVPPEAIDLWLKPFAETEGWPPKSSRWNYLLPHSTSLAFWRGTRWEKSSVDVLSLQYSVWELKKRQDMFDSYINGDNNSYSGMRDKDGKIRLSKILEHLLPTGSLPCAPILFKEKNNPFTVIDGNHRFLALNVAQIIHDCKDAKVQQQYCHNLSVSASKIEKPNPNQEIWFCYPTWNK